MEMGNKITYLPKMTQGSTLLTWYLGLDFQKNISSYLISIERVGLSTVHTYPVHAESNRPNLDSGLLLVLYEMNLPAGWTDLSFGKCYTLIFDVFPKAYFN